MDRRDFLKCTGAAGLALLGPGGQDLLNAEESAQGVETIYEGPLYFMIKADGGWDPTQLCDPKGTDINRLYGTGDILPNSNIPYAPGLDNVSGGLSFFEKYRDELLVINGIDMATNSHNPGRRYAWTGRLDNVGYPTFAALIAGVNSPQSALAHMSFGYAASGGVVPLARFSYPGQLNKLKSPNRVNELNRLYHPEFSLQQIELAGAARRARLGARHTLPHSRSTMSAMYSASESIGDLSRFEAFRSGQTYDGFSDQIDLALASFKAGLCVSANVSLHDFDTHDNHDAKQIPRLNTLLAGVDFLLERAAELDLKDRLTVILGSDFSREPKYNKGQGKDHWSVGSMMFIGPNIQGDRVIGATDAGQRSLKVDPNTLDLSDQPDAIAIRPEHIHHGLRKLAGVDQHEYSTRLFPLEHGPINLFGELS